MQRDLTFKNAIKAIFGASCGAVTGIAAGFALAIGLGLWSQWSTPNDPTAGSVAIVVIFTAPLGMLAGIILGGMTIINYPKLFWRTAFPIAILVMVLLLIDMTLRQIFMSDEPRLQSVTPTTEVRKEN